MSDTGNQPAFPPNAGWRDNGPDGRGMTLRQWYAGQALAGLIANPNMCPATLEEINHGASRCFDMADAMIAEGGKP